MNSLPQTTKRRLKKIPQVPTVWEGDRRPVGGMIDNLEPELQKEGDCIMWVDASEGFVRSMEIVRSNAGPEAMVRALLKAIETPHSPAEASRPQKIVVCDREIQFFLRGALQNLDITVDYVPNLVLIDELWRNFEDINLKYQEDLPSELEDLLEEVALEIWDREPWLLLADHDIIKIEFNLPDLDCLYACVMGMLGQEYGIILYRSLDSLKKFRNAAFTADDDSLEAELESAFLQQDCWFVNFAAIDEDDFDFEEETDLGELFSSDIQPLFGSIHPYEGMSPLRDEEEFFPIYVALQALKNFLGDHEEDLMEDPIKEITHQYDLNLPIEPHSITVTVSTMPELASELVEILEEAEAEEEEKLGGNAFFLKDDLIPSGSIISLTTISWELWADLRLKKKFYLSELGTDLLKSSQQQADDLPVVLLQTTRSKAKALIEKLALEGGITGITFNPGMDPYEEIDYDIGILQTPQNNLYIFAQFPKNDSNIYQAVRQWQKKVKKINGICGFLVAMGVTGTSRSNPQLRDLLGLFETKLINNKDLGIGTLTLNVE
jgi:hypothetical protein